MVTQDRRWSHPIIPVGDPVLPVGHTTPLVGGHAHPKRPKPSPFSAYIHPGAGAAAPIDAQLTYARRTTLNAWMLYPGVATKV